MARQSIFDMNFSKVYSALIQKAERKGRTRAEVDELIAGAGLVTKEYVDTQDEATLQSAKDYTDLSIQELDAQIQLLITQAVELETQRAEGIENALKRRIDNLFDYRTNTLYLNNEENNE